jgi:poly(A) polymerase
MAPQPRKPRARWGPVPFAAVALRPLPWVPVPLSNDPQHRVEVALRSDLPVLTELGRLFAEHGASLALVGGSVRDALMGRQVGDLDFATSARPDDILAMVTPWADTVWDVGIRFGTVGARKGDRHLELTTFRADSYHPDSRKPEVQFGDSLHDDLLRRDFTVNAMALTLPALQFVDPYNGLSDLIAATLRTPAAPATSFSDDPLRMMRAARFVSQLGFQVEPRTAASIGAMSERISIVSAERVQAEFTRLLLGENPRAGLGLLVDSGLAQHVLPELPALKLEIDEHHRHKDVYEHSLTVLEQAIGLEQSGPDLTLRLAALLHDIGKPKTRRFESGGGVSFHHHEMVGARMTKQRLKAMRYGNELIDDVSRLVELHLRFHGYGTGQWTDAAVRRYVRDAGPLLGRLHQLTRADCTTRNRRRALALQRSYDALERRIEQLQAQEELAAIRPDLDGNDIMRILGLPPGREVGEAYRFLMDLRLDRGPLGPDLAREALLAWWAARP